MAAKVKVTRIGVALPHARKILIGNYLLRAMTLSPKDVSHQIIELLLKDAILTSSMEGKITIHCEGHPTKSGHLVTIM